MNITAIVGSVVLIVLVGASLTAKMFYDETKTLKAEKATLEASVVSLKQTNADNVNTINRITAMRAATDRLLADIASNLETINAAQAETTASLSELMSNDADARTYLQTDLPDSVKRLLNK